VLVVQQRWCFSDARTPLQTQQPVEGAAGFTIWREVGKATEKKRTARNTAVATLFGD
jgi:hypothetical protein